MKLPREQNRVTTFELDAMSHAEFKARFMTARPLTLEETTSREKRCDDAHLRNRQVLNYRREQISDWVLMAQNYQKGRVITK